MSRLSFSSLRVRLLLLVLLAVIPAFGLMLYTASNDRASAASDATADALRVARNAARDQAQLIEQARQVLVDLSQLPSLQRDEAPICSRMFNDLRAQYLQTYPRYTNLGAIDRDGNIFCSVLPVSGPANVAARGYFQRALQTLEFTVGDAVVDRALGKAFVNFVYPILDFGGGLRLMVFATLDLEWLSQLAAESDLPEGSILTVVDQAGNILARYPDPEHSIGQSLPESPLAQAIRDQRQEGTTEIDDVDGVRRLYAFSVLSSAPTSSGIAEIYVSVGIPSAIIFEQADQVLARNLLSLGLVAVMALLVTWVGGDIFVVRQVRSLLNATRRLAAGDLKARADVPSARQAGELGQLAQAFDRMAEALEQREATLRASEAELRALFAAMTDVIVVIDGDGRYLEIAPTNPKLLYRPVPDLVGKRLHDVFPSERADEFLGYIRRALQSGQTVETEYSLDIDGFEAWFTASISPMTEDSVILVARDITERKRAEEALQTSEARNRALVDAIPDLMLRMNREGTYLDFHAERTSDLIFPPDALIGMSIRDTSLTRDLVDKVLANIQAALDSGEVQTLEYSLPLPDGLREYEARSVASGTDEVVAIVRDITERKRAEEALRRWAHIFEHAEWGVVVSSAGGGVLDMMNPAYAKMHGYTVAELVGKPIATVYAPGALDELNDLIRIADETGHAVMESTHVRKDGTIFPVLVDLTAVKDDAGKVLYRIANVQDIAKRRRAEEALQTSEARFRSAFDDAAVGMALVAPNGEFLQINRAYCDLVGYAESEMLGKTFQDITYPDDLDADLTDFRRLLAGEISHYGMEKRYVHKRGHVVWGMLSVSLVRGASGAPLYTVSQVQDVTQRKQAEEALLERARALALGNEIGIALTESKALRAMLQRCAEAIVQHLDAAFARIWTLNDAGYVLELQASAGLYTELDGSHSRVPVGHLKIGRIASTRQPHLTNAVQHDTSVGDPDWARREGMVAFAGYPLIVEDELLGVMALFARHPLTPLTIEALASAAGGIAIGVKRAKTERLLRERETQYRNVFESSTDGLFINDLGGRLVDFNPAAAHMHGYTVDEFRQLQPTQFIHPDSLPLFDEYMATVTSGRTYRTQAVDVRKDGSLFNIEVIGTPFTYRGQPHTLAVVRDITEQVRAQELLEQRVAERTRELSALLEVAHNVASTLELKPLLELILDQLKTLVDYDGAALFALQGGELAMLSYRGPIPRQQALQGRFALERSELDREIIRRREPIIIGDTQADTPLARIFRESAGVYLEKHFDYIRSWIGVPLMIKEWTLGMLTLDHSQPNYYTEQHARLAMAIANQAAIAIENAQLYEQAQQLAALEERQKLARELHDSVSQALYGIALGARTARTLLDRDPSKAAEPIDYVLSLAEAGLAEMRALIFELRPESLEIEGLVAALTKQAASLRTRHNLEVHSVFADEPPASLTAKEALYRIAQEALNNIVKHARATRVDLRLETVDGMAKLEVRDDGVGFDPRGEFPGHLGLRSMRERVQKLGGTFEVESAPGSGARIRVQVPIGSR